VELGRLKQIVDEVNTMERVYKVAGYALTNFAVADLLRNLQRSQHFANVDLISSEQVAVATQQIKKFSIRFQRAGAAGQPADPASPAQRKPGA